MGFVEFHDLVEPELFKGIGKDTDEGKLNHIFQLSFQKAFNTNPHPRHLRKTGNLDIRTKVLAQIINRVKDRKQHEEEMASSCNQKIPPMEFCRYLFWTAQSAYKRI